MSVDQRSLVAYVTEGQYLNARAEADGKFVHLPSLELEKALGGVLFMPSRYTVSIFKCCAQTSSWAEPTGGFRPKRTVGQISLIGQLLICLIGTQLNFAPRLRGKAKFQAEGF
jgi:hypothetical protein